MAYSNLGDAYLKLIRIGKAIQSYNNAIRIQQSSQTYNKLALCYKIKGDVLHSFWFNRVPAIGQLFNDLLT